MGKRIEIYDTTLRDGAQTPEISFSMSDKLQITKALDALGIDFIEGGWPGSNPKDTEFFQAVPSLGLKKSVVTAFSMTCKKGLNPQEDDNMAKTLQADTSIVTLVGKSWRLHIEKVLQTTLNENLRLIETSCAFFKSHGRQVFYDAEHFFDGFRDNPPYALETLRAAIRGGAERIILCDTNGGTLPDMIGKVVDVVDRVICLPLGIHAHNDGGLAIANTLAAVGHGVVQVQGTINGYGERCGNADLIATILNLQLKMGFLLFSPEQLARLTEISHFVSEAANLRHNPFQPFVGECAFTHKGGMHADAMRKCSQSYQHIAPEIVGNRSNIVVSELSGKSNILTKAREFGIELTPEQVLTVLTQVKRMEGDGFQFELADASLELLLRRSISGYKPPFEVINFSVFENRRGNDDFNPPKAIVKLLIGGETIQTVAEGDGPINALDRAVRKALLLVYPALEKVHLTDYKVRILDEKAGTGARVRVLISYSVDGRAWVTVGSSTDLIEASWQALIDGLEFALLKHIP